MVFRPEVSFFLSPFSLLYCFTPSNTVPTIQPGSSPGQIQRSLLRVLSLWIRFSSRRIPRCTTAPSEQSIRKEKQSTFFLLLQSLQWSCFRFRLNRCCRTHHSSSSSSVFLGIGSASSRPRCTQRFLNSSGSSWPLLINFGRREQVKLLMDILRSSLPAARALLLACCRIKTKLGNVFEKKSLLGRSSPYQNISAKFVHQILS